MKLLLGLMFFLGLVGCSTPKKINKKDITVTNTGFRYQFAFSGNWSPISSTDDEVIVSENLKSKESSKVALARHGRASFLPGKELTHEEILKEFQIAILEDSNKSRFKNLSSHFQFKKYQNADCLESRQTAEDHAMGDPKKLRSDILICIHPLRLFHYVWLGISEKSPKEKSFSETYESDKNNFFTSLSFVDW